MTKRVVLIGAAGFVGSHILSELAKREDWVVSAAGRSIGPADVAGFANAIAVTCDLEKLSDVVEATSGADFIICCYREQVGTPSTLAIKNLSEAAKASGASRLIYLSSVAVYGVATGVVTEDVEPVDRLGWYGQEKRDAEHVLAASATTGLSVVVLRPSLIYGPGGREWSVDFALSVANGHLTDLGNDANGMANLIYVEDLATFCVKLLTTDLPSFLVLNVNGEDQATFNDYFKELSAAIRELSDRQPKARWTNFGGKIRRILRGVVKAARKLVAPKVLTSPTISRTLDIVQFRLRARPHDFPRSFFSTSAWYSADRAVKFGFSSQYSLQAGVRATVIWMRSAGLL